MQWVSGVQQGSLFYPQVAGVALSFNPYAWSEQIDPAMGMMRLVMGLGTRAVDRSDDDYTRVVSFSDSERRPESHFDRVRQYAQKRIDVLDLEDNQLTTRQFTEVAKLSPNLPLAMVATVDDELEQRAAGTRDQRCVPVGADLRAVIGSSKFSCDPIPKPGSSIDDQTFYINGLENNR